MLPRGRQIINRCWPQVECPLLHWLLFLYLFIFVPHCHSLYLSAPCLCELFCSPFHFPLTASPLLLHPCLLFSLSLSLCLSHSCSHSLSLSLPLSNSNPIKYSVTPAQLHGSLIYLLCKIVPGANSVCFLMA